MSKFIAVMTLMASAIALHLFVMIHAWGLRVQSWNWLMGGICGSLVIQGLLSVIRKEK